MRHAYLGTCILIYLLEDAGWFSEQTRRYLATALHYGCDEFWTNDGRLSRVAAGIAVDVLTISAKGMGP